MKKKPISHRYRSAKTGRFVSKKTAKRRPATTVSESFCSHAGQMGKRYCKHCGARLPKLVSVKPGQKFPKNI